MASKSLTFSVSGTFIVPANVSLVYVTMIGGGGGGHGESGSSTGNGAGGSGEFCISLPVTVVPGNSVPITIGAAGLGGSSGHVGTDGGNTQFGSIVVNGGKGSPSAGADHPGGAGGGSGGGAIPHNGFPGVIGSRENPCFNGGGSGSSCDSAVGGTPTGGYGGGFLGGLQGTGSGAFSVQGSGGGGASTFYGQGGKGGNGTTVSSGLAPSSTNAYGAGGGGSGSVLGGSGFSGGNGRSGFCVVTWIG